MKQALLAISCMAIFSCNSAAVVELEDLKQENASLRNTIDSLRGALAFTSYREARPAKTKKKKSSKKSGTGNVVSVSQVMPYSPFSSQTADESKPVATERSFYKEAAPEPVRHTPSRAVSSYSGQCQAMTQKGSQCKRTASGGSYCWQHGG